MPKTRLSNIDAYVALIAGKPSILKRTPVTATCKSKILTRTPVIATCKVNLLKRTPVIARSEATKQSSRISKLLVKQTLCFTFLILSLLQTANALDLPTIELQYEKRTGKVISITNKTIERNNKSLNALTARSNTVKKLTEEEKSKAIESADKFLQEKGNLFGIKSVSSDLYPENVYEDSIGQNHVRYEQRYKGVPVYGAEILSHLNSNNEIINVNGNFIENLNLDTKANISRNRAFVIAKRDLEKKYGVKKLKAAASRNARKFCRNKKKYLKCVNNEIKRTLIANEFILQNDSEKLIIYNRQDSNYLTYKLTVTNYEGELGYDFYIDAKNGDILDRQSKEQHITRKVFDCADPPAPTDTACYIDLFWAYGYVTYYHGRSEGQPARGPIPAYAPYYVGSTEVDQLYDKAEQIHNYYVNKFGRNGANNQGGTGNGVNYPVTETRFVAHANLGGGADCSVGGAWVAVNNAIRVCKDNIIDDVLSHEYGHVVAMNLSGGGAQLGKTGQPGTLNESNSDILGESFERYTTGANNWLIGKVTEPLGTYRDLSSPESLSYESQPNGVPLTPYPDRFYSINFYCGSWDSGGIHVNSTVPSKAAYLASVGGTFNGCTIQGIGLNKVEQVWYRALTTYFTANETFNMAYNSFNQACQDLVNNPTPQMQTAGINIIQSDCDNVKKALQSVELDQGGACSGIPRVTPECAQVAYNADFNNDGQVNLYDYDVLKKEVLGISLTHLADANSDNVVTLADYTIWLSAYGQANPPSYPTKPGDANFDNVVDGADYLEWQQHFSETGPAIPADFNADGSVDAADYVIWRHNFGS